LTAPQFEQRINLGSGIFGGLRASYHLFSWITPQFGGELSEEQLFSSEFHVLIAAA
jgi:hypothetical protein